jgi:hypothetical protein
MGNNTSRRTNITVKSTLAQCKLGSINNFIHQSNAHSTSQSISALGKKNLT